MRLLGLVGLGLVLSGIPAGAEPVILKFGGQVPSTSTTYARVIKPWIDRVNAAAGDSMRIDFVGDGLIAKNGDGYDRVEGGVADIVWDTTYSYGRRFETFNFITLPGLYTDSALAARAVWRAYEKGVFGKEMRDSKALKPVVFMVAPQNSFFLKKEPKDLNSLTGLKIAITSKQRAVLVDAVGGTPLALTSAEFYQAAQKGVIDGVATTSGAIDAFKLQEILHYYVFGPFGGGMSTITMSRLKYDALPDKAKKAIDDNSYENGSAAWSKALSDLEKDNMVSFLKDPQNKQVFMTEAALANWQKGFDPVVKEYTDGLPEGAAIIRGFKAELAAVTAGAK